MRFLPQGDADVRSMLERIGVSSISKLFDAIPGNLRHDEPLDLPPAQSEMELREAMGRWAGLNATAASHAWFLGAGVYNHYIPAAIGQLLLRSEFYTSYTPYQPEISQGTLQSIFEFQSLIASLTEFEIANASLYDGASAMAEGVLMARRARRGGKVLLSEGIHPHYARVIRTYVRDLNLALDTVPIAEDGRTDLESLERCLDSGSAQDGGIAVVAVQSPNFFGCVEDLGRLVAIAKRTGVLVQVGVAEALSLGLLHGPGHYGADIAVGEGQSLGIPAQFGGPVLGFMAARQSLLRQMPGRLAGAARDAEGRAGYVLTLATREQHIRRGKATSNICTNQGLMSLAATIYMSLMGKEGMREVARQNHSKAVWARERLAAVKGCSARFTAPIFNEFVLDLPGSAEEINRRLLERKIMGGLPLGLYRADLSRSVLFCVTEMNSRCEIECLVRALEEILS